jgi:hypothetical protein
MLSKLRNIVLNLSTRTRDAMPKHLLISHYSYVYTQGTAILVGGSLNRTPIVSLGIFSEVSDGIMCPRIDSASKNE